MSDEGLPEGPPDPFYLDGRDLSAPVIVGLFSIRAEEEEGREDLPLDSSASDVVVSAAAAHAQAPKRRLLDAAAAAARQFNPSAAASAASAAAAAHTQTPKRRLLDSAAAAFRQLDPSSAAAAAAEPKTVEKVVFGPSATGRAAKAARIPPAPPAARGRALSKTSCETGAAEVTDPVGAESEIRFSACFQDIPKLTSEGLTDPAVFRAWKRKFEAFEELSGKINIFS